MIRKLILFFLVIKILLSIGVYFYFNNFNQKDITTLFVISDETLSNKPLHLFLVKDFQKEKQIKILFINDDITVVKKKVKSIPIKEGFYLQNNKNRIPFLENEIKELFDDSIKIDNYVFTDVSTINSFVQLSDNKDYEVFQKHIINDNDYDNTIISNINFINHLIDDINRYNYIKILKFFYKNKSNIHTHIPFNNFLKLYHILVSIKNVYFADITTIERRNRIEVDKEFLEQTKQFFNNEQSEETEQIRKVKVLNSSKKERLAIKVVDLLRSNNFDIFDWGGYNKSLDSTIIIDYVNDYQSCKKIQSLINCGDIIYRPNKNPFADILVILAKDCNVTDKLDKIR